MAPGCFSGVAAVFLLFPIYMTAGRTFPPGQGLPWPIVAVDVFGFVSAATVVGMYRQRHRVLLWNARRQATFAGLVWLGHVLALVLLILAMVYWR